MAVDMYFSKVANQSTPRQSDALFMDEIKSFLDDLKLSSKKSRDYLANLDNTDIYSRLSGLPDPQDSQDEIEVITLSDSEDEGDSGHESSQQSNASTNSADSDKSDSSIISFNGNGNIDEDSNNRDDEMGKLSCSVAGPTPTTSRRGTKRKSSGRNSQRSGAEEDNELLNNQGQITALYIDCIVSGCRASARTKLALNHHLEAVHNISPYRCLQKGCSESFHTSEQFSTHLRTAHKDLTIWTCALCEDKSFKQYCLLYRHSHWAHQNGLYKCAYSKECDFVGNTRGVVYAHFKQNHQIFECSEPSCGKQFRQSSNLKRHIRMHARVKPYSCTWDGCAYSSEFRSTAINHIRVHHFKLPRTVKLQREQNIVDDRDPRNYLMVNEGLLKQAKM